MTGTSGSRTGHVRVLVVDDEPTLTDVLSVAVTEAGRRPCPAADGHSVPRGPLRRAGHGRGDEVVRVLGDLVLAEGRREVRRAGTAVQLTAKEFDGGGNLVEVCISSLRREVDMGRAPMIHTVRGLGYANRPAEDGR